MKLLEQVKRPPGGVDPQQLAREYHKTELVFAQTIGKHNFRLSGNMKGTFNIFYNDKSVWTGKDPIHAAETYNELIQERE